MEKKNKHSAIMELPDYLIENYIFPYLKSRELFFIIRAVSPEWHEMMKSVWGGNIKDEMYNQIKNLSFIYEKDALTKAYEFKLQYLLNYRNLLTIYNINANVPLVLHFVIHQINDDQIFNMVKIFFECLEENQCLEILLSENNIDNIKEDLLSLVISEEKFNEYRNKMNYFLEIDNMNVNYNLYKEHQTNFSMLDKEYIENQNENCRLIYSFIQGLIEFQLLKGEVKDLKDKVELLFKRIQQETALWPKRKRFFETAYKFLLFSKSSNKRIRFMLNIFEKYRIKSPLMEFKEESFKLMIELKNKMEIKKREIIQQKNNKNMTNENVNDEVNQLEETFLQNLLDRRVLLTKKLILTEKFEIMYIELASSDNSDICIIKGEEVPLKNFLIYLIIAAQIYGDKFNEDSIFQIKEILKKKSMKFDIKQLFYNDEEIKKQKEIQTLKIQKENLIMQKKKTEQVLSILKKYLLLKENLGQNKKKYKLILYLLCKIRKGKANQIDMNALTQTLNDVNLDNINFNDEDISGAEKEELDNFETSDKLLKEIELSLSKQINSFFQENEDEEKKINDEDNKDEDVKEENLNDNLDEKDLNKKRRYSI